MTRKTEMKLFNVYVIIWKLFFHIIAIYLSFKHSYCLGLIMLYGSVLHNILTLVVVRGKS